MMSRSNLVNGFNDEGESNEDHEVYERWYLQYIIFTADGLPVYSQDSFIAAGGVIAEKEVNFTNYFKENSSGDFNVWRLELKFEKATGSTQYKGFMNVNFKTPGQFAYSQGSETLESAAISFIKDNIGNINLYFYLEVSAYNYYMESRIVTENALLIDECIKSIESIEDDSMGDIVAII